MQPDTQKIATKVSLVSIFGNLALTAFKFLAGILGHSNAMISDAVHSASDVVSSMIVIIGVKVAQKAPDKDHPYGHERFESVAAIILSVILIIVGGTIGFNALRSIIDGSYQHMIMPGMLALAASIVSIVSKGAMFFYTRKYAIQIHSPALLAEGWHHLSDALSSIGALIGIGGAMLGAAILEPLASIVICVLILKAAADIFKDSIDQMVDHACDENTENEFRSFIEKQDGVLGIDILHGRMFGSRVYLDLEIRLDGNLKLSEAHKIAEQVHEALEKEFPQIKHVMIHVNPAD